MKEKFNIKGMSCASCQAHIQNAVSKLDGVNDVNVNLLSNSMEVDYDETKLNTNKIEKAVKNAGYSAKSLNSTNNTSKGKDDSSNNNDIKKEVIKLVVSFVILLVLMYVAMGPMIGMPLPPFLSGKENALTYAFTQLLLTVPIIVIYNKYFVNGFKALFKLHPTMDSLIAIGASASLVYGIFAIYMIGYGLGHQDLDVVHNYMHSLYFESVGTILTLVSLGKFFEMLSKRKTTKAVESLIALAPKKATILKDSKEVEVAIMEVKKGDIVISKKGDAIPIDGVIIEGTASINQANITGESLPVFKKEKDYVYSSTIIENGYVKIKAEKVGTDTSINEIIRLVDEAANSKAPISKLVDKVSLFFVPTIIIISIFTLGGFLIARYPFEEAFNFAISILVIACPCALGLATPVAIMVGSGKGAQNGLLIKNAEILEKTSYITKVVLDKTGTITKGEPIVTDFINLFNDENLLKKVKSLEVLSNHPLANAIINYQDFDRSNLYEVKDYNFIDGLGLEGKINGDHYLIGNKRVFDSKEKEDLLNKYHYLYEEAKTVLFIKKNDDIVGLIAIKDIIRDSSVYGIKELIDNKIEVYMLTGDNKDTALAIAKEVGIKKENVYSDVLPLDKEKIIKSLEKDDKHLVAMVGDGVNDALALTTADIGIAIGGGSDVALSSSDVVLLRNNLLDVLNVIRLSKRTLNTIKGNLFWAFFYNCVGILLACGAFYPSFGIKLNPMIASLAMAFSSVFVVLNALTINFFKSKETRDLNNK